VTKLWPYTTLYKKIQDTSTTGDVIRTVHQHHEY